MVASREQRGVVLVGGQRSARCEVAFGGGHLAARLASAIIDSTDKTVSTTKHISSGCNIPHIIAIDSSQPGSILEHRSGVGNLADIKFVEVEGRQLVAFVEHAVHVRHLAGVQIFQAFYLLQIIHKAEPFEQTLGTHPGKRLVEDNPFYVGGNSIPFGSAPAHISHISTAPHVGHSLSLVGVTLGIRLSRYIIDKIECLVAAAPDGLLGCDGGVFSREVHIDCFVVEPNTSSTTVEVGSRRAAICAHGTITAIVEVYIANSATVFERVFSIIEVDVITTGIIVEVTLYVICYECVATATRHRVVGASVMGDGFWTTLTTRYLDIKVGYEVIVTVEAGVF